MQKTLMSTTTAAVSTLAVSLPTVRPLGGSWHGYRSNGHGHAVSFAASFAAGPFAVMPFAATAAAQAAKQAVTRNDAKPLGNPPGAQPG